MKPDVEANASAEQQMQRMSRRSFLWAAAAVGGAIGAWRWLISQKPLTKGDKPWPFRRTLELNESIASGLMSQSARSPDKTGSQLGSRANGTYGLAKNEDLSNWTLTFQEVAPHGRARVLRLSDIQAMPATDMTTEFCCIEGWSQVMAWRGVRFADFLKAMGMQPDLKTLPRYVSMATPNAQYYVGLDMASAIHPQTLLAYDMNGAPLKAAHGAPLRLVIPTKYGVKNIKRLGIISLTQQRPRDFWAAEGYDWYAGL